MEMGNYQINESKLIQQQAAEQEQMDNIKKMSEKQDSNNGDEKLKKAVSDFSAVFLKMMFKSMRSTLPENKYLDGGYAEEVFTDMMDKEVSKLGSGQSTFKNLNKVMFEQLSQK